MPRARASTKSAALPSDVPSPVNDSMDIDSDGENQPPQQVASVKKKAPGKRKTKPASKRLTTARKPKPAAKTSTSRAKRSPLADQSNLHRHVHKQPAEDTGVISPGIKPSAARKPKANQTLSPPNFKTAPRQSPTTAPSPAQDIDGVDDAAAHSSDSHVQSSPAQIDPPGPSLGPQTAASRQSTATERNATISKSTPKLQARRSRSAVEMVQDDHASEPALRRKLGDLTQRYQNLETRFRDLRDIGVREAATNLDKLQKQANERNRAAEDLIGSLRTELSASKDALDENAELRAELSKAQTLASSSESRATELLAALTTAQSEMKTFQAKLAAMRSAGLAVESYGASSKVPGSATKGKGAAARTIMMGSAEAAQAAQIAQLKEDLYSDLTGLIIRNVTREEDADAFDCIQTGRNGTLHFKLLRASDSSLPFDEAEIQYVPRLDSSRDEELLEVLPDYLRDEITFSNNNATKFYGRVLDTLTRRMVESD